MNRLVKFSLFAFFLISIASPALRADPPARVARLNYIQGNVSFRPAGVDDWTDANINRVLIPGDELWADTGSRVEIHLGSAAIRAAESTDLGLVASDDQIAQLRVSEGTVDVRLRNLDEDQSFEIDTPTASISLLRSGSYRIFVTADGNRTQVSVRSGEAEATVSDGGFAIRPSQMAIIDGSGDTQTHEIAEAGNLDDFDSWSGQRDVRDDRAATANNVSIEMVGYEDLEDNGRWEDVAGYGRCWSPNHVDASWAPYRDGHWAWINPWGWTWVDDASWGFAPYHYGRWANSGGRWFWAPGERTVSVRPIFAPALVVFAGGPGIPGGHGMAWFPLAPGEIFVPSYHVAASYTQRMNAPWVHGNFNPATVNMTTVRYRNQGVNGAVTVVSTDTFQNGRPVARGLVALQPGVATRLAVSGTVARIAPGRGSVLVMPATPRSIARPPMQVLNRPVRALIAPPPPPLPFAVQQKALDTHPGRPLDTEENRTIRVSAPKIAAPPVRPALPKGFVAPPTAGHPAPLPVAGVPHPPGPPPVNHPVTGTAPGSAGTFQTPATSTTGHQPPPRPIEKTPSTPPPAPPKPPLGTPVKPPPPPQTNGTQGGPEHHGPPTSTGGPSHNPPTSTGGPSHNPPNSTGGPGHNPPTSTGAKSTTTTSTAPPPPPPHKGPSGPPPTPPTTSTGSQGGGDHEHHGPPPNHGDTTHNAPTTTTTTTKSTTTSTAPPPPPHRTGPPPTPPTPPATSTTAKTGTGHTPPPPGKPEEKKPEPPKDDKDKDKDPNQH